MGRFKHFTGAPDLSSWMSPLRAVAGLRVALSAVDLSFRGEVRGRVSGCRCSRRAVLARRRATTRTDFLMLIAPGVSIARSHTSGLGSESETGTPQDSHPPKVNVISYPLCKLSDIRTIWKD